MRSIDGEVGQSDRCPRPQGPASYATDSPHAGSANLPDMPRALPLGELSPQATERANNNSPQNAFTTLWGESES